MFVLKTNKLQYQLFHMVKINLIFLLPIITDNDQRQNYIQTSMTNNTYTIPQLHGMYTVHIIL